MHALTCRARRGKIINLLDSRLGAGRANTVPYTLSKKMLAELTVLAAKELAPAFTVNAVAPGAVLAADRQGGVRHKAGRFPLGRRPTLEDVAQAVVFLLRSAAITGQIICVDGGQHLLGSSL